MHRCGRPALLAAVLRWRHRGTFLALWSELDTVSADAITLNRDHQRYSPILHDA